VGRRRSCDPSEPVQSLIQADFFLLQLRDEASGIMLPAFGFDDDASNFSLGAVGAFRRLSVASDLAQLAFLTCRELQCSHDESGVWG
jgi:hypothetical protein